MGLKGVFSRLRGKSAPITDQSLVAWFHELPPRSVSIAGGKGASLGDMLNAELSVPMGFVVCAASFRAFLEANGGVNAFISGVRDLDVDNDSTLAQVAGKLREFVMSKTIPAAVEKAIRKSYTEFGENVLVAVRSSATSEDSETASFAGQQETFLNVQGADTVLLRVRECWASFFTPRALFYRAQKGSLSDSGMAVVVQRMVKPDKSGVLFTVDPVQGQRDHMIVEAVFGLGEAVVSGAITPDHYVLSRSGGLPVREHIAVKPIAVVYDEESRNTCEVTLSDEQSRARVLSNDELRLLVDLGLKLEAHFGKPQDVEWSIEGGEVFLLQSRPITTL